MVLPFEPMTVTFENVQYFVDTPKVQNLFKLTEFKFIPNDS